MVAVGAVDQPGIVEVKEAEVFAVVDREVAVFGITVVG